MITLNLLYFSIKSIDNIGSTIIHLWIDGVGLY